MHSKDVAIPLKRFLLTENCPDAWQGLDLYLFRDEEIVFYVGQSQLAFSRVWEHLKAGFHGHSLIGRFVWCNWPKSMNFTIELLNSKAEQFSEVEHDLDAAEQLLIQRWAPCFNISLNKHPHPLPGIYLPPNAPFRKRQGLSKLMRQAEQAVKADETNRWLESLEA
ncbi:MAG: hypothetical protein Kow002_03570 [Anaerolineales bacterium]